MFETVDVPIWLLVTTAALAAVVILDRVIGPGVRWVFRGAMERMVARLNLRLQRKIEPFRVMNRHDWVVRLLYDQKVLQMVAETAKQDGIPGEVVLEEARTYAREIVPGFSALFYFGFAARAAKWLTTVFYRVRVGHVANELAGLPEDAAVIFVMNHRSNMDYVLVTWLVAERSAISYAVGEWARVWPLSRLIRAMGAYFIRRGSRNALYRRVLARYIQMAMADGAVQAVFPEGGLSVTGRMGAVKLGVLSYVFSGAEEIGRDVYLVPVGLAYDRVLEDMLLIRADQTGERRFRPNLLRVVWDSLTIALRRVGGRKHLFGSAAVGFGPPISLAEHRDSGGDLESLGTRVAAEIIRVIPVLPVPLLAASIVSGRTMENLVERLVAVGAMMQLPAQGLPRAEAVARELLQLRGILDRDGKVMPQMQPLLWFYAGSVLQRLEIGPGDGNFCNAADIKLQN